MKPIFLVSVGDDWNDSLQICVASLRRKNRKNLITVFGDSRTAKGDYKRESIWTYTDKIFESFLDYHYTGQNSCAREWFCIMRWFVIWEYCRRHGINEFLFCDSDVLVFSAADEILPKEFDYGWTSGISVFNRIKPLQEFCEWLPSALTEQFKEPGDWNDMTLWQQFAVHHCTSRNVKFFNQPDWDYAVDPNLSLTDGWDGNGDGKLIQFDRQGPWGTFENRKVRLHNLHCWGPFKQQMKDLWMKSLAAV